MKWSCSKFLLLLLSLGYPKSRAQTLYRRKDYRPYYSLTTSLKADTRISCALKCFHLKCPYFTFLGTSCEIHDPGFVVAEESSMIYQHFVPVAPPSESLIDAAFQKTCYASPYFETLEASRAVDGDLTTQYHSLNKIDTWWCVDLGNTYVIWLIDILPHPEVASWFRDVKVYIGETLVTNGDFSTYTEVLYFLGPWDGANRIKITPPSMAIARFVAIQGLSGMEFLNIIDVKVMV
ncbi:uncharacterized protein [Palaemon carinicauda]|uniref:uncharacterized protein n=1 Tax=Palaemon carinicauda TaxID=392227 RepID=UPI0035B64288